MVVASTMKQNVSKMIAGNEHTGFVFQRTGSSR